MKKRNLSIKKVIVIVIGMVSLLCLGIFFVSSKILSKNVFKCGCAVNEWFCQTSPTNDRFARYDEKNKVLIISKLDNVCTLVNKIKLLPDNFVIPDGKNSLGEYNFEMPRAVGRSDWSADGKKLAFTSGVTGHDDLYISDANGQNPVSLTNNKDLEFDPLWSPLGTKLLFNTTEEFGTGAGFPSKSFIYDFQNKNAVEIFPSFIRNGKTVPYNFISFRWIDDSTLFTFPGDTMARLGIGRINLQKGFQAMSLTGGGHNSSLKYSAEAKAYLYTKLSPDLNSRLGIWSTGLNGNTRKITNENIYSDNFYWVKNSHAIVYAQEFKSLNLASIWFIQLDGTDKKLLVDKQPIWSIYAHPKNDSVYYYTRDTLWRVNIDSGKIEKLGTYTKNNFSFTEDGTFKVEN